MVENSAPKQEGHDSFVRKLFLPGKLPSDVRENTVAAIADGAGATRRFYVLLALSTMIAALGLLANSAAVIIGAMIVAPLMGPILGLSLGMISRDRRLERNSLFAEVTGVALTVLLGFAIGHFPLKLGVSAEMLARTSPNAYDLCIAFVSGLAGGYASVNPKVNSAFAGVAIAVALVPPLATSGLLLSMGNNSLAFGAFLLFLVNFFSIQLASALVFGLFGLGMSSRAASPRLSHLVVRLAPGTVAFVLMGWYMTGTLAALVRDHHIEEVVRTTLSDQIARRTGGRLEKVIRREERQASYSVVASALTPAVFEPLQVRQIEANLSSELHRPVSLVLRSIVSQDIDRDGRVFLNDEEKQQSTQANLEASYLEVARTILGEGLTSVQGAWLANLERQQQGATSILTATVQSPTEITSSQVADLQETLSQRLKDQIRLIVRNVFTKDVDSNGFLYEERSVPLETADPILFKIRERTRSVLESRLRAQPARSLKAIQIQRSGASIQIHIDAEATQPIRPQEVARTEADLRRYVSSAISLSVRTVLGATASATSWK